MAFYLGIYSKKGLIDDSLLQPVISDFAFNGSREIHTIDLEKFRFYYVEKFKRYSLLTEDSFTFLSGWIDNDNLHPVSVDEKLLQISGHYSNDFNLFLKKSEGAFALVSYDLNNHVLRLSNDKFGVIPLFIFENEDYIVFSNEYEPLSQMPGGKILNPDAIAEYYTLGSTIGEKTFLKNIKNLEPGSLMIAQSEKVASNLYWKPVIEKSTSSIQQLAKETWQLFKHVDQQIVSSQRIETVLLSAGADSRLILAGLTEEQRAGVKFFTSNLSHLTEDEDQDVISAKLLAKKFDLQHLVEKISYYENEFGGNYFLTWRVLRPYQVYGGWHGGEFLGGFCLNAAPLKDNLIREDVELKFRSLFSRKFRRSVKNHPWKSYSGYNEPGLLFHLRQFIQPFFTTIYGGTRGHWVQPFQLVSHGYSPFWDSRIIQKILSVPVEFLKDYRFYNEVFKNVSPEFLIIASNSPLTKRADAVISPLETGVEPKFKIPDVHADAFKKCFNNKQIWDRKFYKKKTLKKVLKNANDPISKKWLDFEIWFTEYMKL